MKNLIILVGIIFSSLQIILAGDLEYPLLIDGGEINIRYYSNKAFADNIVNYKTEHRSLKNISNENIYIYEAIKYSTYDSIISAIGNSNFFSLDINRPILKQGDSLDIFCKFFSKYLDPISLTGNKLMSIWRTYYRRESSLKLDSIDISLLFNAVDKDEVVFDQLSGRVLSNIKNGYKTDSDTSYNFSFFYNLTDKKILIDSINHVISGVNFKKLIILKKTKWKNKTKTKI